MDKRALPTVRVHGGDYLHTASLGGVFRGLSIEYARGRVGELHRAVMSGEGIAAAEFSLASLCMAVDRGMDGYVAVPVFPYRAFRHHAIYVRRDSDIVALSDLDGRRVAVAEYSMTAAVWARALLAEDHDVDWRGIVWHVPRTQRFAPPASALVQPLDGEPLQALEAGHVDALIAPEIPQFDRPLARRTVRRLVTDPMARELDYARRHRVFPINHVVVVRRDLARAHPELCGAIVDAYAQSAADSRARLTDVVSLPWGWLESELLADALGEDPFAHGLTPLNVRTLEAFFTHCDEQRLVAARPRLERLFATC